MSLIFFNFFFFHFFQADSDEDLTHVQPRRRVPAANNQHQDDYNSKCLKIALLCYDTSEQLQVAGHCKKLNSLIMIDCRINVTCWKSKIVFSICLQALGSEKS